MTEIAENDGNCQKLQKTLKMTKFAKNYENSRNWRKLPEMSKITENA